MNYGFYDDMMSLNEYLPNPNTNYLNNSQNNDVNLFNTYEGYLKGNAFKNEYIPYKNYQAKKININSEQEEMLVNIGQYAFMMHDLNLYLDVHPDSQDALNKFMEYHNMTNELVNKYERKYGPLCVKGIMNNNVPFAWENTKWPFGK